MENSYQATLELPIGKIGIRATDQHLLAIHYLNKKAPFIKPKTLMAKEAVEQLLCYFADPTYRFQIPLLLQGTPLQKNILSLLQKIPVGTTQTYTDIAKILNTSPRPVGNACRTNPIPIIIPCHRVVAKNNLGGYSGQTSGALFDIKRWLLQHEAN